MTHQMNRLMKSNGKVSNVQGTEIQIFIQCTQSSFCGAKHHFPLAFIRYASYGVLKGKSV